MSVAVAVGEQNGEHKTLVNNFYCYLGFIPCLDCAAVCDQLYCNVPCSYPCKNGNGQIGTHLCLVALRRGSPAALQGEASS